MRKKRELLCGCQYSSILQTEKTHNRHHLRHHLRHHNAPHDVKRLTACDRLRLTASLQSTISENPLSYHVHDLFCNLNMNDIKIEIINTTEQIGDLVDWLVLRHAPPVPHSPTMYMDLEGVNLCREGSLSILTLMLDTEIPTRRVCLLDVHLPGAQVFNTAGVKQKTLKDIFEDDGIPKVFFDVRNDSDALFAHFGVALQGVEDVQLMESATRRTTGARKFLSGLAKCVEKTVVVSRHGMDLASWKVAKEKGGRLFKPEHGGSYQVFNQRPIPEEIILYCIVDVIRLPELRDRFWEELDHGSRDLVNEETKKRVTASQKSEYQPHGRDKAVAPWTGDQNRALDNWNDFASDGGYYYNESTPDGEFFDGENFVEG